jgi:hypothetical protein
MDIKEKVFEKCAFSNFITLTLLFYVLTKDSGIVKSLLGI